MAAATVDNHHHHLHINSLPLIDVRLLSHSDLLSLSLCSTSTSTSTSTTTFQYDDEDQDSTPKIDASVFNESAGSRKQTFSRLRLAPRNSSPLPPQIPSPSPAPLKPLDEENSQVISLLKSLLNIQSSSSTAIADDDDENQLIPVQVEFEDFSNSSGNGYIGLLNIPVELVTCGETKRKRGRPRKDEGSSASDHHWLIASENGVIDKMMVTAMDASSQNTPVGIVSCETGKRKRGRPRKNDSAFIKVNENENGINNLSPGSSVSCETGKRKRGRPRKNDSAFVKVNESENGINNLSPVGGVSCETGKRKRGRPRKNDSGTVRMNQSEDEINKMRMVVMSGDVVTCETSKRKPGRPRKDERMQGYGGVKSDSKLVLSENVVHEGEDAKEMAMENKDGVVANVVPLANVEDPFWEELRRTEGIAKQDELLEFWRGSNGEW